jgi:hypothetical protein
MSLSKSVPEGLKPQECEPPPVPYMPMKDEVQEEVAKLRNLEIKTTIKKDTTLNFPVWHETRTREALLMHVTAVLDAIKKRGHFKNYGKVQKECDAAKKAIVAARAGLSLLDGTRARLKIRYKIKALAKAKEATKEALAKTQDSKSEAKEAKEVTEVNNNTMKAGFQEDLEKAKQAQETTKGAMTAAASLMFTFYLNLLSPDSKYT